MSADVKTLLLLSSSENNSSFSFLFYFAKHWAQQGSRVLFISATPLAYLPLSISGIDPNLNPDSFKLIQFMYLANWKELLAQLYSIHQRHNPVSVIIIKNLENYFESPETNEHNDLPSLVSASLLYAASICAQRTGQEVVLISDYVSKEQTINKNVVLNFFPNIWQIIKPQDNDGTLNLKRLSWVNDNEIILFKLEESVEESKLKFVDIVKKIINCSENYI